MKIFTMYSLKNFMDIDLTFRERLVQRVEKEKQLTLFEVQK